MRITALHLKSCATYFHSHPNLEQNHHYLKKLKESKLFPRGLPDGAGLAVSLRIHHLHLSDGYAFWMAGLVHAVLYESRES